MWVGGRFPVSTLLCPCYVQAAAMWLLSPCTPGSCSEGVRVPRPAGAAW